MRGSNRWRSFWLHVLTRARPTLTIKLIFETLKNTIMTYISEISHCCYSYYEFLLRFWNAMFCHLTAQTYMPILIYKLILADILATPIYRLALIFTSVYTVQHLVCGLKRFSFKVTIFYKLCFMCLLSYLMFIYRLYNYDSC